MQSKAQIQLAPHGEDRSGLPKSFRSGSESSSFTPGRPTQHTIIGTSSISSYNCSIIAALKLGAGSGSEAAVRRSVGWRFERKLRLKIEPRLGVESAAGSDTASAQSSYRPRCLFGCTAKPRHLPIVFRHTRSPAGTSTLPETPWHPRALSSRRR